MVWLVGSGVPAVSIALTMIAQTFMHNLITTQFGFRVLLVSATTLVFGFIRSLM